MPRDSRPVNRVHVQRFPRPALLLYQARVLAQPQAIPSVRPATGATACLRISSMQHAVRGRMTRILAGEKVRAVSRNVARHYFDY